MNYFKTLTSTTLVLFFSVLMMIPFATTVAQDSGNAASNQGLLEEIIVTARKREENLMDIPESVVAISGLNIDRQNIKSLEDVGLLVPSLNLSARADGFPNVSMRGLGSFGNTQGVGFYLDDVQVFSDASSRFGDMERIEVLKGPQGTLYGGSNIGGAIKFVSARPDPDEFSGRVKALVGEQSIMDIEASMNIPMANGWAMRAFAFSNENDGYLKNRNTARVNGLSTTNDPNVGASEEDGMRLSMAGPVNDNLSAYFAVRYNDYEGPNNVWIRDLDKNELSHSNIVDTTQNPRHIRETVSAMLELTWEMDGMDVMFITSHTDTDSTRYTDLDIREEYLLDLIRPEDMKVSTQEIRFTSTDDGPVQWLAGIYFSRFDEKMMSDLIWFDARAVGDNFSGPLGCALGMPTCSGVWAGEIIPLSQEEETINTDFEWRNRDKDHVAGFFNITREMDNDMELGFGLRIDRWENSSSNLASGLSSDKSHTEVLPRFSVSKTLDDDSMLYFTAAQGYEPGGYNLANFENESGLHGFDAEEATSLEIGWKGTSSDGRVLATVAAFFIDYDDRQIEYQAESPSGGVIEGIVNLGDSEQKGLEASVTMVVNDNLNLSLSGGWVDAEWKPGASAGGVDLSGTTPPVVPDFGVNLNVDYQTPISNQRDFIAGFQISHNGEYEGLQAWDPVTNPDYMIVNAQMGVVGDNWELMFSMKNLLDEDYYMDVQHFPNYHLLDGGDSIVIGTLGQPRLFTVSYSYSF